MDLCDGFATLYFGVRLPSDPSSTDRYDRMLDEPNPDDQKILAELDRLGLVIGITHEHHLAVKEYATTVYDGDTESVAPNALAFEMGESDKIRDGLRVLEVEEGDCEDGIEWHLAVGIV